MSSLAFFRPAAKWFISDESFNELFPVSMQRLAQRHWTPLRIVRTIIDFLTPHDEARVLDIGSGIGKFCLSAGFFKPSANFTGIEQRANLVELAVEAQSRLQLNNVYFQHGNFTELDFSAFDHFYYFNSFYENLSPENTIDDSIEYTEGLYNYYSHCLHKKLADMPPGTRIVTFHSLEDEIPLSYHAVDSKFHNRLKFWIKDR